MGLGWAELSSDCRELKPSKIMSLNYREEKPDPEDMSLTH